MSDRSHWTKLDWMSLRYHPSITCACCNERFAKNIPKPIEIKREEKE